MVELLMEHYGISEAYAIRLMKIPVMDAVLILQEISKERKRENESVK